MNTNHNEHLVFKTKLTDGRSIQITDDSYLEDSEFMIIVDSESIMFNHLPVLLRKKVSKIDLYSRVDNRYITTEINKQDMNLIQLLITNTPLNKFNVLFAKHVLD